MQTIQSSLFQKEEFFSQFFSAFLKSVLNFEDFRRKMTLIASEFLKLPTLKDMLR